MSAGNEELVRFVREAIRQGHARPRIREVLLGAGWTADQIRDALDDYAEIDFPIPVPRARPYLSARETFLYLVLFSTLYISAIGLGTVIFQLINRAIPDPADLAPAFNDATLRWAISYLIVAFPVFLYVSGRVERAMRQDPNKRFSIIRRWLTYLTLFVAACFLIGDVTGLVYGLLGGELTVRFVLKVLTVAVIAGAIFGYYLRDLRAEEGEGAP